MTDALVAWGTIGGVVVALVLGIVGLVQSSGAKRAATAANRIADAANVLAAEANGMVQRQANRELELSDVAWEWRYDLAHSEFLSCKISARTRLNRPSCSCSSTMFRNRITIFR